jgi:XRE family transcriptional regulator of biofilm formation
MAAAETSLASRLRSEREKAGLSLNRLAEETGMSKTYLLRLERDEDANPSLDVLRRVTEALDITIADLIGVPPTRGVSKEFTYPPSLLAFADEEKLTSSELEQLASIRWRRGDAPESSERWRFILQSLRASKQFDR